MIEVKFDRYQHIPILEGMKPTPRILLGKTLLWTIKEDGECITLWLKGKKRKSPAISSRNMESASSDIQTRVKGTQEYPILLQLLKDNPHYRIVVEECRKGRSVTGIKTYDRDQLFVIDIFDFAQGKYLPYVLAHQICYHIKIPIVKLFAETRHRTMKDLRKFANHVLEHCNAVKEEGMVIKTYADDGELIQAKVKLDVPQPVERKIRQGEPILPQIPENEIWGALSKVEADCGLTGNPKDDMPKVAQAIELECKKHLYSKPKKNFFAYYQDYLERMSK
jgi:hypothetical protein